MNEFKIGDKVRLRDDLEVGKENGELTFSSGMKKLQGKELTIEGMSLQGNYELEESYFLYSEEMLEKATNNDLFEFALGKLNMTKEELEEEYKKSNTNKQEVEDIKKRYNDFKSYCNNEFCDTCEIHEFKEHNGLSELGTGGCMLIYEHLFKK